MKTPYSVPDRRVLGSASPFLASPTLKMLINESQKVGMVANLTGNNMETRHETACFAMVIDLHLIQGPDERAELVALRTKIVFDLHELEANCYRIMNPLTDQTMYSPIRQKSRVRVSC